MEDFIKENQIQIELNDEVAQGTYSNLAVISHSISEFVVDFIRVVPRCKGKGEVENYSYPEHAKRLLHALEDNIKKFEQQNGTIRVQKDLGFAAYRWGRRSLKKASKE